jgi:tRNA A37 threonylcarbamoyladenosine dehydratase
MPQDVDWQHMQRQWDFLQPDDVQKAITVIGCGAVGSVAATCLLKMGMQRVEVWDADTIEAHNLANQFLPDRLGDEKVDGLNDVAEMMGLGGRLFVMRKMWEGEPLNSEIVVSAADSMAVRRQLFAACVRKRARLFVDVRTGGEYLKCYAVDPTDAQLRADYLATLHTDDASDPVPCTASQIIYTSLFAGAMIAHRIKQWLRKEDVPFLTMFDIQHEAVVPRQYWTVT